MQSQELGDYIGAESCVDFNPDIYTVSNDGGAGTNHHRERRRRSTGAAEKEYPPAIPWLAGTGNLPQHVRWVMKRYSTCDGRLVIREERVRRREYLLAHRFNGRLLLNLVPLDEEEGEEKFDFQENVGVHGEGQVHSAGKDNYSVAGINSCGGFVAAVAGFAPPVVHT